MGKSPRKRKSTTKTTRKKNQKTKKKRVAKKHKPALQRNDDPILDMTREGKETDTVLVYNGEDIHLHKEILTRKSLYCKGLLDSGFQEKGSGKLTLNFDFEFPIFLSIIHYLYTGIIPITEKNVKEISIIAGYMMIEDLTSLCSDFLKKSIGVLNVCTVRKFAIDNLLWDVKKYADKFLDMRFEDLMKHGICQIWSVEDVEDLISSDCLRVSREDKVLRLVCDWVKYSLSERGGYLNRLLERVRFSWLTHEKILKALDERTYLTIYNTCGKHMQKCMDQMGTTPGPYHAPRCYYKGIYLLERCRNNIQKFSRYWPYDNGTRTLSSPKLYRQFSAMVALDEKVYLIGGVNNHKYSDVVEVYDAATNKWGTAAPLLYARCAHGCVAFEGKIYVFGGSNTDPDNLHSEVYDPVEDRWTLLENDRKQRGLIKTVVHGDGIFLIGGDGLPGHYFCTIQEFKPRTGEWIDAPQSPHLRKKPRAFEAVSYGDKLYVFTTLDDRYVTYNTVTKKTQRCAVRLGFSRGGVGGFFKYLLYRENMYTIMSVDGPKGSFRTQIIRFDPRIVERPDDHSLLRIYNAKCHTSKTKAEIVEYKLVSDS